MSKNIKKDQSVNDKISKRKPIILLMIVGVFFLACMLSYIWYSMVYQEKIYVNVMIGDIDFSGLTKQKASDLLKYKIDDLQNHDLRIVLDDREWVLNQKNIDLEYDIDQTVDRLYLQGRDKNFYHNVLNKISLLFRKKNIEAVYKTNQSQLSEFFNSIYQEIEEPIMDAQFELNNHTITIVPEKSGILVNKSKLQKDVDDCYAILCREGQIQLVLENTSPKITQSKLETIKPKLTQAIQSDIVLQSEAKNIIIDRKDIFSWLFVVAIYDHEKSLTSLPVARAQADDGYINQLELNQELVRNYIDYLARDINQEPKNAKLGFANGAVYIVENSQKGYKIDTKLTTENLSNLIISRMADSYSDSLDDVAMSVESIFPEISSESIDTLGIIEKIGSGTTSFHGSPANRIHNIKVGAKAFHGLVIKPDQKLSTVKTIGYPDATRGYLPELVIKENKTIPEYGGGLCQVSTTLFRVALDAGFEILERTNHTYRVGYYEPPIGMDATIYYPKPDLLIKNNTPAYVLIETIVDGSKITFNFYGTHDGREVHISDPVMYDVTPPPEDKYIESPNLPSGVIRKQEGSYPGAKASFSYKVIRDGQSVIDRSFVSIYRPWQAVYLYGPGTENIPGKEYRDDGGEICSNECEEGWMECVDGGIRRCYKSGDCWKWSGPEGCGEGKICADNQCVDE
jgi:vancomycin resistance protein YoaR